MKNPLILHLKASLICALIAIVVVLPLLWAPLLPAWDLAWRPTVISPRVEALLAVVMAFAVAWCVVDIPRRGLKVLVWLASLWLLFSGIWLFQLYGHAAGGLVPLAAAGLAGAVALTFSFSPAGSRRARWESLVGSRIAPEFLRAMVDQRYLEEGPRREELAVSEILWPSDGGDESQAWDQLAGRSAAAVAHFQRVGGYLEHCDSEGARFVFGCWGNETKTEDIIRELFAWVDKVGGCASLVRGQCLTGVGHLPAGTRWTVGGAPLRQATRMAAAARSYAAKLLVDDTLSRELSSETWNSRRLAWWDFEGERVLLREVTGPFDPSKSGSADLTRRWDSAWEAFWSGDWTTAGNGFSALAREENDGAARIFALRSDAARQQDVGL